MAPLSSAMASDLLLEALTAFEPGEPAAAVALRESLLRHRDGDVSLAQRLLDVAGDNADRRAAVLDFVGHAAGTLAPDDHPPAEAAPGIAWSALISVANSLNGSGVRALGRPHFISDGLFRSLVAESRRQCPTPDGSVARETGQPGDMLAALAVSRQLNECVSAALGVAVAPTYEAIYEYDPPGSHVRTHVDSRDYEIVFHLLLEHRSSDNEAGRSVLIAHLPEQPAPSRIGLRAGEALVLRGRGTIHSWQALGDDERRTLIAVGFRAAD